MEDSEQITIPLSTNQIECLIEGKARAMRTVEAQKEAPAADT